MSSWKVRGAVPIFIDDPSVQAWEQNGWEVYRLPHHLPQLINPADPSTVPHVTQVHSLAQVLNEPRPVNGQALSARVTHAVVHNSIRAAQLQLAAEGLRGDV